MDFKDHLLLFVARVEKLLPQRKTEEAKKNALIMPFSQVSGDNEFNPFKVNPEFIAGNGIKRGKGRLGYHERRRLTNLYWCKNHLEMPDPHTSRDIRYFRLISALVEFLKG